MPQFANDDRLHANGCFELYVQMEQKNDPAIADWKEARKDETNVVKMNRHLELNHVP